MNSDAPTPEKLLRQQHRWMLLGAPLLIVCAGLAVLLAAGWLWHPSWSRVEAGGRLAVWWGAGVALTLALAAGWALLRRRRPGESARELDVTLGARNRLETAAALRGDAGPLARVQREETSAFLRHAPVRPPRWPLLALGGLGALLLLAHLATLITWTRPWEGPAVAKSEPPPAAPVPKAFLTWKTPGAEIKASPIEEVPLEAVAESTSGLRDLVLVVEVNGEPRLETPLPPEAFDRPGSHPVFASLYLDQLEVQPFQMVSYHLRAQRIDSRDLPVTVSSVQFVQIKPFREDVGEGLGGGGGGSPVALILALKVAQLRLIRENFVLAHAELERSSPEWRAENDRVGADQTGLEAKTGEVIQKLIDDNAPAEAVNLLTQARAPMKDAAAKILLTENKPALAPQGRALALLTEVEKLVVRVVARGGASRNESPNPEDPFRRQQELELKQRLATKAGELELLAREQARLAEDLARANPPPTASTPPKKDPNRIEGSPVERQTQISQRLGALLNGGVFPPEVSEPLTRGQADAGTSLRRLDADDPSGAREPAASAARELRLVVNLMNQRGEEGAQAQLLAAMRNLDEAAREIRDASQASGEAARGQVEAAAAKAAETARQLDAAARRQQEAGSADAAARLRDVARALNDGNLKKAMESLRDRPHDPARAEEAAGRLEKIAEQAGREGSRGELAPQQIAGLVEQMERTRANMERLAGRGEGEGAGSGSGSGSGSGGPGGAASERQQEEFAAQLLQELRRQSLLAENVVPHASNLNGALARGPRQTSALAELRATYPLVEDPLRQTIDLLRAKLQSLKREHRLVTGDPGQAPVAYRAAVAEYFEELSRDFQSAAPDAEATSVEPEGVPQP